MHLLAALLARAVPAAIVAALALAPPALPDPATASPGASTETAQQAYDSAVVDLLLLDRRLASAKERRVEAEARATSLDAELAAAETARATASDDLADLERRRAHRLRGIYMDGKIGWLGLLVESGDLTEFLDRMFLMRQVVRQETDLAARIASTREAAAEAVARLEAARAEQTAALAELVSSEHELAAARAGQQALTSRLGARLAEARAAAAAAKERMDELNAQAATAGATGGSASSSGSSGASGSSASPRDGGSDGPAVGDAPNSNSHSERPPGRQLTVKATAYALPGTTASGVGVRYGIVAVDPRVIPLGTRLWIPGYGEGLAADTGGAIKGNRIDVWLPSEQQALDWGVKTITITILD